MSEPRFTYISCDARWDPMSKLAAIAACAPGRPLAGDIVAAETSGDGELRAILAAMDCAAGERLRCVEFRCDCQGVVAQIHSRRDADGPVRDIRRRLQIPPRAGLWRVQWVHRSDVQPAHRLAELLWKAFLAGQAVQAVPA